MHTYTHMHTHILVTHTHTHTHTHIYIYIYYKFIRSDEILKPKFLSLASNFVISENLVFFHICTFSYCRNYFQFSHTYIYNTTIYIIYIAVLFGPVKPELGVIPSGQKSPLFYPSTLLSCVYSELSYT